MTVLSSRPFGLAVCFAAGGCCVVRDGVFFVPAGGCGLEGFCDEVSTFVLGSAAVMFEFELLMFCSESTATETVGDGDGLGAAGDGVGLG